MATHISNCTFVGEPRAIHFAHRKSIMQRAVLALACALGLAACTTAQVTSAVTEGQLVCAVGPTVVKLSSPSGAAILAKGATKAFVDAACATISGIAVSPPGAAVPTVTIVPPAVSIPLKG